MSWSVELAFPTTSSPSRFLQGVASTTPLSSLLTYKRVRSVDPSLASSPSAATFVMPVDPFAKEEDKPVVHVLDRDADLAEALRGKRVLEWPKIQVWPAQTWEEQVLLGKVVVVGGAFPPDSRGAKRAREEGPSGPNSAAERCLKRPREDEGENSESAKRALVEYASSDGGSDDGDAIP